MKNIKLTIEYDGRRYLGWQRLGDSDKTIQGKIENIIHEMTGEKIEIIGSGRTDAGTHARGQVANFKTASTMPLADMQDFLNRYLPQDIVITKIEEVHDRFHARYNATGKQYSYYIWNQVVPNAFERNRSYHIAEKLDCDLMEKAGQILLGTHDFIGFSALKKTKKSTVRTIESLTVTQEGRMIRVTISGNGFLHKMVRIITGTLIEIGLGHMPVEAIEEILQQKVRKEAGETVPAQGLYLDEVYYK